MLWAPGDFGRRRTSLNERRFEVARGAAARELSCCFADLRPPPSPPGHPLRRRALRRCVSGVVVRFPAALG
eukprot:5756739-Alexandrium_andersonii.AAC.1